MDADTLLADFFQGIRRMLKERNIPQTVQDITKKIGEKKMNHKIQNLDALEKERPDVAQGKEPEVPTPIIQKLHLEIDPYSQNDRLELAIKC